MTGEPQPQQGFNLDEFEERLHTFIASNYPELTLKQHEDMCEGIGAIAGDCCTSYTSTTSAEQVLEGVFVPMDKFYGNLTKTQIIEWSVSQQNSFITNATASYLLARELRSQRGREPK